MKLNAVSPSAGIADDLRRAIADALPGSEVSVTQGQPAHFSISVTAEQFRDKSRVAAQRLVYQAITHLMKGEGAPVHAVDTLRTQVP